MKQLKKFLDEIYKLADGELESFLSFWKPINYKKGEIISRAGEVEKYFYFIEEGIQKAYYVKEGKEYVIAFTVPPSFTCIPESFLTQKPSFYFLEAITESILLRISHSKVEDLANGSHQIEKLLRKSHEQVLAGLVVRYHQMLAYPMKERFNTFVKRSAHLLNVIPHKDIASYLGMDPTNFSKLYNSTKL